MKNKIWFIILLLFILAISIGGYIVFNKQEKNNLVQNKITVTTTAILSNNNIYHDETNGFEFNMPISMKDVIFHTKESYENFVEISNFYLRIYDKQTYATPRSANSFYNYFYDVQNNAWYRSIIVEDADLNAGNPSIESTEKVCDNKIMINSQPFYFANLGEEGLGGVGYFALLDNGKLIEFYTISKERFGSIAKGEEEIKEALKTFKTLGQVKLINTTDCK